MNTPCKDYVQEHCESRLDDIRQLWKAYQSGDEVVEDLGTFNEYGLCFDYVSPGTFTDQEEGYFRYQISYGGPSEEFRFYTDGTSSTHGVKIEFWFLDWFDGACVELTGSDYDLMAEILDDFEGMGLLEVER